MHFKRLLPPQSAALTAPPQSRGAFSVGASSALNSDLARFRVIAIALLLATVCAAVPAVREGLIRLFTKDEGTVYSFEFTQEDIDRAPKEIVQYYAPSYIPPQFSPVDEAFVATQHDCIYLDEAGNVLFFAQCVLWQSETDPNDPAGVAERVGVNAENATEETAIMQGYEVRIYRFPAPVGTEDIAAVWTDHEYFYVLSGPCVEREEIDRIIESMVPVVPK